MIALLEVVREIYMDTPALVDFAPWPLNLEVRNKPARAISGQSMVDGFAGLGTSATEPVISAIRNANDDGHWIQTYTVDEVGQDFLNRYGYFELFGPTGHFITSKLRGYVGFWGAGLDYGWHNHEAEEMYFCLGGEGLFMAEGEENKSVVAGQSKYHSAFQKHAMSTTDRPFLCLAFWRGSGIDALPMMTP